MTIVLSLGAGRTPVEPGRSRHRKGFIHPDEPAGEQPIALDPSHFAVVLAGRQQLALACDGREVEKIAARAATIAGDFDAEITERVTELRAAPPGVGDSLREFAQARLALMAPDDGAVEPSLSAKQPTTPSTSPSSSAAA